MAPPGWRTDGTIPSLPRFPISLEGAIVQHVCGVTDIVGKTERQFRPAPCAGSRCLRLASGEAMIVKSLGKFAAALVLLACAHGAPSYADSALDGATIRIIIAHKAGNTTDT